MGNCSLKGVTNECPNNIRVLTDSGCIVEFKGPKLAKEVLNKYPGFDVFRQGHASSPLYSNEYLLGGQVYYLLPHQKEQTKKLGMEWSNEIRPPKMSSSTAAMDFVEDLGTGPALEVLPTLGNGVWRVKLAINSKQLEEILSEQVNTEALIEKMRKAATAASLTPRRKSSWKPAVLSNVFKVPH